MQIEQQGRRVRIDRCVIVVHCVVLVFEGALMGILGLGQLWDATLVRSGQHSLNVFLSLLHWNGAKVTLITKKLKLIHLFQINNNKLTRIFLKIKPIRLLGILTKLITCFQRQHFQDALIEIRGITRSLVFLRAQREDISLDQKIRLEISIFSQYFIIKMDKDDPFDYGDEYKYANKPLLAQKSTYCFVIAFLFAIVANLSYHSIQRYRDTSTYSNALQPFLPIHAGEIHYSRVPNEYWQHRILMMKAMGLNTLSVYVMWNFHQTQKGQFDFVTQNRNLVWFLTLAKKNGMNVLLRPGPYVCAEWDFGGLPARMLGIEGIEIRSANKLYQMEVKQYFTALAAVIRPFLYKNKGPIIMIQIENEFGYYTSSNEHTNNLRKMWIQLQIQSQFYYADAFENWRKQYWPDAHIGVSGGINHHSYHAIQISHLRTNNSFIFGGEIYSGWLTHWGESKWGRKDPLEYYRELRGLIVHNRSASIYVAFGGTNFGLTAGANGYEPSVYNFFDYMPHVTSYDYDAPISERGRATEKYFLIRSIFEEYYATKLPYTVPEPITSIRILPFLPVIQAHLWANLPEPVIVQGELTYFQSPLLKMYNQGIVIYQTNLIDKGSYRFNATIHDVAIIYIDDVYLTTIVRQNETTYAFEGECENPPCKLTLLVEAMGHVNYGRKIRQDRKGLLAFRVENRKDLTFKWNIYTIELNSSIFSWQHKSPNQLFPAILRGEFEITEVGDTYLDMSGFVKGYVWINGRLLGRYWNIGPQQRLYCPGVWLRKGENTLIIVELLSSKISNLRGYQQLND